MRSILYLIHQQRIPYILRKIEDNLLIFSAIHESFDLALIVNPLEVTLDLVECSANASLVHFQWNEMQPGTHSCNFSLLSASPGRLSSGSRTSMKSSNRVMSTSACTLFPTYCCRNRQPLFPGVADTTHLVCLNDSYDPAEGALQRTKRIC